MAADHSEIPAEQMPSAAAGEAGDAATTPRKRTPGRWRRIPPAKPAPTLTTTTTVLEPAPELSWNLRAKMEKGDLLTLKNAEFIENMREEDCDLFTEQDRIDFHAFKAKMAPALRRIANSKPEKTFFAPKQYSDTREEHLTADDMEARFPPDRQACRQAQHFAQLALAHYNGTKTTDMYDLSMTLLSNCFSECCGTTYGHVNFTAVLLNQLGAADASPVRRLFFAELKLVPELLPLADKEPMRVLHVCTIDDDSCFGGCHEIFRKIDYKMVGDMDYER